MTSLPSSLDGRYFDLLGILFPFCNNFVTLG
uniref:Uncharacterized protein n=1 Tax=Siphoviridae sp. ct37J14 TaxID=2826280 RepID=A0A8S5M152_9CAUD|nr:MAG TPA: hypothetical protein [Siphoviridae sp. ct37J14]